MTDEAPKRQPTSARLSPRVKAGLAAAAAKADRSESWIIEKALIEWLSARNMLPKEDEDQPTS